MTMTTTLATPAAIPLLHRIAAAWTGQTARPAVRPRALFARICDIFESHDDYFAELERSLPLREREQRRERRQADRLLLMATLVR